MIRVIEKIELRHSNLARLCMLLLPAIVNTVKTSLFKYSTGTLSRIASITLGKERWLIVINPVIGPIFYAMLWPVLKRISIPRSPVEIPF